MKDARVYLHHILAAIDDIRTYTTDGEDVFMHDRMRQDAVVRKLEVIGEATKQLSDSVRQLRPRIPWREIAGMRDKMIHEYFGVNLTIVWAVVERDLPTLRQAAIDMLAELQPPSST